MPNVYNLRHDDCPIDAVYIGRGSPFGNPFTHLSGRTPAAFKVSSREVAVLRYKDYFLEQLENPEFAQAVEGLRGKDLKCYCAPLLCHGNIILDYLEGWWNNNS